MQTGPTAQIPRQLVSINDHFLSEVVSPILIPKFILDHFKGWMPAHHMARGADTKADDMPAKLLERKHLVEAGNRKKMAVAQERCLLRLVDPPADFWDRFGRDVSKTWLTSLKIGTNASHEAPYSSNCIFYYTDDV